MEFLGYEKERVVPEVVRYYVQSKELGTLLQEGEKIPDSYRDYIDLNSAVTCLISSRNQREQRVVYVEYELSDGSLIKTEKTFAIVKPIFYDRPVPSSSSSSSRSSSISSSSSLW